MGTDGVVITPPWHRWCVLSALPVMAGQPLSNRKCNASWETADEIKYIFLHQIGRGVLFQEMHLHAFPCHCFLPCFVAAGWFLIDSIWVWEWSLLWGVGKQMHTYFWGQAVCKMKKEDCSCLNVRTYLMWLSGLDSGIPGGGCIPLYWVSWWFDLSAAFSDRDVCNFCVG